MVRLRVQLKRCGTIELRIPGVLMVALLTMLL